MSTYSADSIIKLLIDRDLTPREFVHEAFALLNPDPDDQKLLHYSETPEPSLTERLAEVERKIAELRALDAEGIAAYERQSTVDYLDSLCAEWEHAKRRVERVKRWLDAVEQWEAPEVLLPFRTELIRRLRASQDHEAVNSQGQAILVLQSHMQTQKHVCVEIDVLEQLRNILRSLHDEMIAKRNRQATEAEALAATLDRIPNDPETPTLHVGAEQVPTTVEDVALAMRWKQIVAMGAHVVAASPPVVYDLGVDLLCQRRTYWLQLVENGVEPVWQNGQVVSRPRRGRCLIPRALTASDIAALADGLTQRCTGSTNLSVREWSSHTISNAADRMRRICTGKDIYQVVMELPAGVNGVGIGVYISDIDTRWLGLFDGRTPLSAGRRMALDRLQIVLIPRPMHDRWEAGFRHQLAAGWRQALGVQVQS